VTLAFLARQETVLASDRTFYDFVPYRFGPFSFALRKELDALARDGYVTLTDSQIALRDNTRALTRTKAAELAPPVRQAAKIIAEKYGGSPQRELLASVYRRYPWYATKSELRDLVPPDAPLPPVAAPAVYTIGYEGKSVDALFDNLLRKGIQCLVDVRANPFSRKYGFAKSALESIGATLGITYLHIPELGIPGEERTDMDGVDAYQRLFDHYETEILPQRGVEIARLVQIIKTNPSVMMCYESDVNCCHRGRLAKAAAQESGLEIIHL
jgi:uncharacterized protein (DUF488 family)